MTRKFYESRNKLDMAIEIYDDILKEHPTNWEALSHKALCCHELGKHTGWCDFYDPDPLVETIALLEKALQYNPKDYISLNLFGSLCKLAGDLPRSVYKFSPMTYSPFRYSTSGTL